MRDNIVFVRNKRRVFAVVDETILRCIPHPSIVFTQSFVLMNDKVCLSWTKIVASDSKICMEHSPDDALAKH